MEFHILRQVIDELAGILPGARLERVFQGDDGGIYLLLHRQRETVVLLLSPDRLVPRIHLVSSKPAAVHSPSGFVLFLRSNVKGARVRNISLLNDDRIVDISLIRSGSELHLFFELFSNAPNLFLTDHTLKILSHFHSGAPADLQKRLLITGAQYEPPPKKAWGGSISRDFKPDSISRWPINRAAEFFYTQKKAGLERSSLRSGISSIIKRALAKTARRTAAISRDLDEAGHADEYRKSGELLLTRGKNLKAGREWADLTDFDGRNIRVKLDPQYSPARNAERYFKKFKKAKKGIAIITARLEQARKEEADLQELLNRAVSTNDTNVLHDIWSGLSSQYPRRENVASGKKESVKPSVPNYHKFNFEGWEILVGKSAAGNECITFKVARAEDLWLHAEGMPGSHVVVRNPRSGEVPPEVLKKAAGLAAYFSKGRAAGKVPVTYTSAKFVKKPKGVPLGTVTLSRRKTIMVVPEAP